MKTLFILLCQATSPWDIVIRSIPSLCWAIIVIVILYLGLRYVVNPLIANCHEKAIKEQSYQHEKQWAAFNETKASTDENLKKEKKELEIQIKNFQTDNQVMKKQLETYKIFFDNLSLEINAKKAEESPTKP